MRTSTLWNTPFADGHICIASHASSTLLHAPSMLFFFAASPYWDTFRLLGTLVDNIDI